jgi:hypothetical protein
VRKHSTLTRQYLSRHQKRFAVFLWLAILGPCQIAACAETSIEIHFFDKTTGDKIASRIEFTKPFAKAPRPRNALVAGRQLLIEGTAKFTPAPGAYEFTVRRGPEFSEVKSGFEIEKNAEDAFEVYVPHKVPMRSEGWYSGDLLSPMAPELLARWMQADDLDVAATTLSSDNVKPTPDGSRRAAKNNVDENSLQALNHVQEKTLWFDRPGQGGLSIHRLEEPTQDPEKKSSSSFELLEKIDSITSSFTELTRPWERDVPLLLASEKINAVQLLSAHLLPDTASPLTSSIRNPDSLRFKGKKGLGRLCEYLYWQMLEAGFRLTPTAGSGFDGKAPTYLGYNRVYAWLDPQSPRNAASWWSQLRAGHAMVTNGPLLRATINGQPPGSIHPSYSPQPIELDIALELNVRDPVEYLDVVFNGKAIYQARLEEHAKRGQFPPLRIQESGWLVLRVVTEHEDSYRMATTAPFYFEFDSRPRISKSAVEFFQNWMNDSRSQIAKDVELGASYQAALKNADQFWKARAEQANAK